MLGSLQPSSNSTTAAGSKAIWGDRRRTPAVRFGSVEETRVGAEVGLEIFSGECERGMRYELGVYLMRFVHLLQDSHRSFQRRVLSLHHLTATTRSFDQSGLMLDGRFERLLAMGTVDFTSGTFFTRTTYYVLGYS